MHSHLPTILNLLLLLLIKPNPATSQRTTLSSTARLTTLTTTRTISSHQTAHTVTAIVTTYGSSHPSLITHASTQTRALSPTSYPAYIATNHASHRSALLIGLLFMGGIILSLFSVAILIVGRRRYQKKQQKRIEDWLENAGQRDGLGEWAGKSGDMVGEVEMGVVGGAERIDGAKGMPGRGDKGNEEALGIRC